MTAQAGSITSATDPVRRQLRRELRAKLAANFFGIMEPKVGGKIGARELDLVLTPLVAFDDRGVRIGVGRGYSLTPSSWDVPLWGAVTEARARRF